MIPKDMDSLKKTKQIRSTLYVSGLVDEISENDKVTFDLEEGRKGLNATNVKLA